VSAALTWAQEARVEAENEKAKAAAARTDEVAAGAAVAGANKQDKAAQKAQDEPAYDSPGRRQQLAESLEGQGRPRSRQLPDFSRTNTKAHRLPPPLPKNRLLLGRQSGQASGPGEDSGTRRTRTLAVTRGGQVVRPWVGRCYPQGKPDGLRKRRCGCKTKWNDARGHEGNGLLSGTSFISDSLYCRASAGALGKFHDKFSRAE
jgi:hypothetical protein